MSGRDWWQFWIIYVLTNPVEYVLLRHFIAPFGIGGNYRTYQRACGTYEEDAFVYLRKRTTGTTCFSWKKFRFSKSKFLPEP